MNLRSLTVVLCVTGLFATWASANPNHRTLDTPFSVHSKGVAATWHQEASKLYETSRTKLLNYLEKEQKEAIRTISAEDLGKTHLAVTMIQRGGGWMEFYGETAGSDFKMRAGIMHGHLDRIISKSLSVPATQKYVENFRQFITKTTQARAKALANIQKLCNEAKWEQAEVSLFKVFDTLEPGTVFLPLPERSAIYQPFSDVAAAIQVAMTKLRVAAAGEELKKTIAELTPNYAMLLQEMNGAVDAIGTSGSAIWRGESLNGPKLIDKLGQTWRETQVQAQQLRGKRWAFQYRTQTGSMYYEMASMGGQPPVDPVVKEFADFSEEVVKALVRLLEKDGSAASPETRRTLYSEYLKALAPLVRQANNPAWKTQLEAGLASFSGKDPGLDREVKNYQAATTELLRWRARRAASAATLRDSEYAALDQRFYDGTVSGKIDDVPYIGLFPEPPAPKPQPQLLTASTEIMPMAVKRLIGNKTQVRDLIRIAPESKTSIARYSNRTFAMIPATSVVGPEVDSLKTDLMVTDQMPPMSLEAMQAVTTAERGDMVEIGGTITGMHLESVITRFASLPGSAAVLMPLGSLPAETFEGAPLNNALMRFEISPLWVYHDYFFLTLAPPVNQTASR